MHIKAKVASLFRLGVRQKVILILIVVLLTALSISSWLTFSQQTEDARVAINRHGDDLSRFLSHALTNSVVSYDYRSIQQLLDEIVHSEDVGYARVISSKGNTMAEAGFATSGDDDGMVMFDQAIRLDEKSIGQLQLGLSTQRINERLDEHKFSMIKREAIIILLIAIGEFIALSFLIIRPVCQITDSLNSDVSENGEIHSDVPVNGNDEFGYLARQFNALLSQLKGANARLRSRIELADEKLIESNRELTEQASQLKEMSDRFEQLSITDALTGLYNRRHFESELESSMALMRRHGDINSVIIMDIDHFKSINDEYGHPCGDTVLQKIAEKLKSQVRSSDTLCRIGGEEFAIICPRTNQEEVLVVAEKIRTEIQAMTINYLEIQISVTVSLGASTINHESVMDDAYVLYRQADQAVYRSKETGRNRVTHFDLMDHLAESA